MSAQPQTGAHPQSLAGREAAAATAEWLPLAALEWIALAWRALAVRPLEPSVFCEPGFAQAAVPAPGEGAVAVWSAGRLIGLFPARVRRHRYGLGPAVLAGWTDPLAPLGTPLVDRTDAPAAVAAWLDFLRAEAGMPRLVLLPAVPENGAFARVLAAVLSARGGRAEPFGRRAGALGVADLLIAPDPQALASFKIACRLEAGRRRLVALAEAVRERIRPARATAGG